MHLSKQFDGYLSTPLLWNGIINEMEQFYLPKIDMPSFKNPIVNKLRLGHLVEQFISYELCHHDTLKIIAKNVQVNSSSQTLGEFDFIIQQNEHVIHLEVAYKFYLFDPSLSQNKIEQWIGPNRKDALVSKLDKIANSQFPLKDHPQGNVKLESLGINPFELIQRTYFKGQLFVPYEYSFDIDLLNDECVYGTYISFDNLVLFKDCKFYIPTKHNWLTTPFISIDWMNYVAARNRIGSALEHEKSPMIWVKQPNGVLSKMFVTWW